jgi:hypothetical protein
MSTVAGIALREALTHPSYWLPALLLLVPTLVLQLAAPTYLRTRLAPSMWTVVVGAVLLVWLTQIALPAICALVHARRTAAGRTLDVPLARLSVIIGTRVTLGLAAIVVPGLWLQARYAFAPLQTSAGHDRPVSSLLRATANDMHAPHGRLLMVASFVLIASTLGQSAFAALAEAMGTITAASQADGGTVFRLSVFPHVITTLGAYAWNAGTLTFYALCVSELFHRCMVPAVTPAAPEPGASALPHRSRSQAS